MNVNIGVKMSGLGKVDVIFVCCSIGRDEDIHQVVTIASKYP